MKSNKKSAVKFDFGNVHKHFTPGFKVFSRIYQSPRYFWIDRVRDVELWHSGVDDPLLEDFASAQNGEMRIGLPRGEYRLRFRFFDSQEEHGPFDVLAASVEPSAGRSKKEEMQALLKGVVVPKGSKLAQAAAFSHGKGALAIKLVAAEGKNFIINALEIEGANASKLQVLLPEAPSDRAPTIAEVKKKGRNDPAKALKEICAWLVKKYKERKFLSDAETAIHFAGKDTPWYTTSYPIRTLLAGYRIFGDEQCRDVAEKHLDKFLEQQMPDGSFPASNLDRATADFDAESLKEVMHKTRRNLADCGSVVAAMISAIACVPEPKKSKYLKAVKEWCEKYAAGFQNEDGSFTNGWIGGRYATWKYNVATSNTALPFALLAKVTGEKKHLDAAQRAVDFLIRDWQEDGRPMGWPHDNSFPGKAEPQRVLEFGDLFYVHEGCLLTAQISEDNEFRRRVFEASRKHLFGTQGLIAAMEGKAWWPIQDIWTNSKSAGMPLVLQVFLEMGKEFGAAQEEAKKAENVFEICRRFLCTPEYSSRIGVMLEGRFPWPESALAWNGCAIAATGFAGIALAEMIKPGVISLQQ